MRARIGGITTKQKLSRNWVKNMTHKIWILLLPVLIVACGGSLGKIQVENINVVMAKSEKAIEKARLANAESLSPSVLQEAENSLEGAKNAVKAKDGLEAMRLGYDALTQAQIAEQEAMYKSQETGLNAIIQRKETEIVELQANLRTADTELERLRAEMQQLGAQKRQLQVEMDRKARETERKRQKALRDYSEVKAELENLQSKLDRTEAQFLDAQRKSQAYERQIRELRLQLALEQSMADEARQTAQNAQAKAKAQAQIYTKQIERIDQSNVLKRSADVLKKKAQEARAYVQRQEAWKPTRTGTTSLTDKQIAKGKEAINDWYLAWASKDINQHFIDYTPDIITEQIAIYKGREKSAYLNRAQMIDAIRKMTNERWELKTTPKLEPDGENIIGTYRLSRLSQNAENGNQPALYDVWTRELWVREVDNQWRIFREVWRIYEDVPRYTTIFN